MRGVFGYSLLIICGGLVPQDESNANRVQRTGKNAEQEADEETQNNDTWEGFGSLEFGGEEVMNPAPSKADKSKKKKKKKRKRKSKDAAEELEVETPQLGDDNSTEENSPLGIIGESATNGHIGEPFAEEPFVAEDPSKPKRATKVNSTTQKRKRVPKSKATIFPEHDAAAVGEAEKGDDAVTNLLVVSQPRKTVKHVKPRKAYQGATPDPDLDHETFDNGEAEPLTRVLSKEDLSELPQRIKKAKKSKAQRVSDGPSSKSQEDDNDSAAMLHQPLTPAHVPHAHLELDTQEANLAASSQLQRDAQSISSSQPAIGEEAEDGAPRQPSKKALGKRKVVDEPVSMGSNKKTKHGKDMEPVGRDLRTYGFMTEPHSSAVFDQSPSLLGHMAAKLYEETHRASPEPVAASLLEPSLMTPRPSWNAVNNPVEPDSGDKIGRAHV